MNDSDAHGAAMDLTWLVLGHGLDEHGVQLCAVSDEARHDRVLESRV